MAKQRRHKTRSKQNSFINTLVVVGVILLITFFLFSQARQQKTNNFKVYFLGSEGLVAVNRPLKYDISLTAQIITALLKGPTAEEKIQGIYTAIPKSVVIKSTKQRDKILEVDFNAAIEDYGGGAARVQGMIAQIVYTFTEITGIEKVKILVEGRGEVLLGGEGYLIDQPLNRVDVSN